ncbi:hypothetical protein [Tepidimonas charontis]|uniref:Lipoprotein n=1 Tax=Tepidimonas charontis TaxID=2267262 RepID=A0A554WYR7_9BURK|nr:hypothetical protein [Tepidimonas charontis]TSE28726.1 hypothetical protein Tchar_02667 [Tepidimonas charontis]
MRCKIFILISALAGLTSGCASVVTGQNQPVSVETRHEGETVTGAHCKLNNDKGTWYVTTPGTVTVVRSYHDLHLRCDKAHFLPGIATVKSTTKAMAFGNILIGGVIGAAVDASSGAAYDYPSLITVEMGSSDLAGSPTEGTGDAKHKGASRADSRPACVGGWVEFHRESTATARTKLTIAGRWRPQFQLLFSRQGPET